MELSIDVNDVIVSGINFGNLLCDFNYINNNLIADISFINSEFDLNNPFLTLNGNVPIYLGFRDVEKRMAAEDSLSISLKSSNFNISTFGNLLPFIKNQSGNLEADVNIFGTLENLYYYGNLSLPEAKFKVNANNLDYVLRLGMDFKSQEVEISQFEITNSGGTKYKGKMNGSGSFSLAGLDLDKFNLKLNGELAVLSNNSRGTSPSLYGDLVIASDGDWTIIRNKEEASFNGKILIKDTDISFVPLKTSYTRSNREFVYNILVDSSKLDQEELKFKRLVSREAVTDAIMPSNNNSNLNFNYNVTVTIEDEAKFSFIFARAVNQGLKSIVNGKIVFENKNGQSRQQGAFTLLEGSKLEFFKALDATGTLRFESDLTNPYMDIVATYTGEYDENPDDQNNEVEEVAVRIKLIGPVSDMASNLTEESGNISVYRSRRNIDNNIPDSQLDAADAIVFLIMSKFKKDLTSSNKISLANEVIGTASSFVGPILTNLISSEVGDIINNIQFSTAGQQTKFQVSGRYQNFKYTLGGTDQTFSNIASADLKVEFLIIPKLLLRAERKSPYISYSSTSDFENKINELALKYRFEF